MRVLLDTLSTGIVYEAAKRIALFMDGFRPPSAMHAVIMRKILVFFLGESASWSIVSTVPLVAVRAVRPVVVANM